MNRITASAKPIYVMKKTVIFSLAMLLVLASCSKQGELERKKKKLETLKAKVEKLNGEIDALETEIAKLDTANKDTIKGKVVRVDTLKQQKFVHYIEIQGMVDSDENVFVVPEMPGVITSINVKEGDRVGRGTVMASTEAGALLNTLAEVKTALNLATTAFEKQKRLWDQKIGSEIQYLQAKANKESLESRLAAVQSQINMTKIKSPISGTVDEVKVKLGEMCSPGFNGIRVVNLDKLKVVAKVSDTYIDRLKKGNTVLIDFPDINQSVESKISFVSQVINPQNRSLTVEINVPNKEKMLKPNMVAKVKINDEVIDSALVIPSNIVQRSATGGKYILVAERNGATTVARKRDVTIGSEYNGVTVILSGLQAGDMIITEGYQEIVDGQDIYVK